MACRHVTSAIVSRVERGREKYALLLLESDSRLLVRSDLQHLF